MRVLSLLLLACNSPDPAPPGDFEAVLETTRVPTTIVLRWDTPGAAHWVEWEGGRSEVSTTPDILLRLHAGEWQLRAVTEDEDGTRRESQLFEHAIPAPPATLGACEVTVSEPGAAMRSHQLALNQYHMDSRWSWATVIDGAGRHRWYVPSEGDPWKIDRAKLDPQGDGIWFTAYHWDRLEDWGTL